MGPLSWLPLAPKYRGEKGIGTSPKWAILF